MEMRWLKQTGAAEAIVVFGGWAVGPEVFTHLAGDQDLLFVSDYRELNQDLPDLSGYGRVSLLAWSFGVASYAHWQQGRSDPFHHKVAVNGSRTPVDRALGVPPIAMQRTIDTLSPDAYQLFLARVFDAPQATQPIEVDARREELSAVLERGAAPEMRFDRVWIAAKDKIFPAANLVRAWQGVDVRRIDGPHAPFQHFQSWEELLG